MNNGLQVFNSAEFGNVRVLEKDGEPWFVASDVAKALGYENPGHAVRDHCKKVNKITLQSSGDISVKTPPISILAIPEFDVYRLIMRSNLPAAERFQDWVCEEVLPTIRKHGVYAVEAVLDDPDMLINALQALKAERVARIHAERTKAEIGSRREATAMATASAAKRKANILEAQLGLAGDYRAVKGIKWLPDMFDLSKSATYQQVGKYLKKLSLNMGYPIKQAPDSLHESVGLYHVDVIKAFLDDLTEHPSLLNKYRHA